MTTTHVIAEHIVETKDTRLVKVRCPHCGKTHTHGWPYGQKTIGVRISHCEKLILADYLIHPPKDHPGAFDDPFMRAYAERYARAAMKAAS